MDLALLMFPALFLLLFIGVPVAYSLFVVSLVFGFLRFGDKAVFQFAWFLSLQFHFYYF